MEAQAPTAMFPVRSASHAWRNASLKTTFEWLDGRRFLIQRSHYDHPEIPDAIAIIGVTDGQLPMHYFDCRGVYRVYAASLAEDQ
jgi:hypothetical protein